MRRAKSPSAYCVLRVSPLQVQLSTIMRLRVEEPGLDFEIRKADEFTPRNMESLRLLSRFPQGLTPEIEKKLLQQTGQTAIDSIK